MLTENQEIPNSLRQWIIEQFKAIENDLLSEELTVMFMSFVNDSVSKGFEADVLDCLTIAQSMK